MNIKTFNVQNAANVANFKAPKAKVLTVIKFRITSKNNQTHTGWVSALGSFHLMTNDGEKIAYGENGVEGLVEAVSKLPNVDKITFIFVPPATKTYMPDSKLYSEVFSISYAPVQVEAVASAKEPTTQGLITNVMKAAWERARTLAVQHGKKPKEFLAQCLKQIHAENKKALIA